MNDMTYSNEDRPLDLVINGTDVSPYLGDWADCQEDRVEWTIHTELIGNPSTSELLGPISGKEVNIKYRIRSTAGLWPWRTGSATINWRITETGREEIILHGNGRLKSTRIRTAHSGDPITGTLTMTTTIGGIVANKEESVGSLSLVDENPRERAIREERLRLVEEAEIQTVTNPSFILFLAKSSFSSYRTLYDSGLSQNDGGLLYSSFIHLPLTIEYFLKYLLVKESGSFKREYVGHRLLTLFDLLPFAVQGNIDKEYQNELAMIGRERSFQNLRVFLMKSKDIYTAIRYLFDPRYAETSRHILRPENIALLTCVCNAIEKVADQS